MKPRRYIESRLILNKQKSVEISIVGSRVFLHLSLLCIRLVRNYLFMIMPYTPCRLTILMGCAVQTSEMSFGDFSRTQIHRRRQGYDLIMIKYFKICEWKFCIKDLRKYWQVLVIVSSLFLFTSIIMLILSTLPEFQVSSWLSNKLFQNWNSNYQQFLGNQNSIFSNSVNFSKQIKTFENKKFLGNIWGRGGRRELFFPVNWSDFCWLVHPGVSHQIYRLSIKSKSFTFELQYLTNYVSFKFEFILSFLNIIDLLGILPFFVSLILNQLSSQYSLEYIAKAAQIFRILRILRIFKLSRHITGLKTLGTTLRNSHRELLLLSMTVSMGMLIFAGLGYALENDEPDTMFYTLPQTLYWAIITMTSTGYGDIAPR